MSKVTPYPIAQDSTAKEANDWLSGVAHILEARYQDDESIQQFLEMLVEYSGITTMSLALPDGPNRYRPRYSSTGISDGVYSFSVQNALCRQFETNEWLLLYDDTNAISPVEPIDETLVIKPRTMPSGGEQSPRCCLVPVFIRRSVLASLIIDLRQYPSGEINVTMMKFIAAQIATIMATQIVPNFATLHARPYKKVTGHELIHIHAAVDKCNGNKTMAAKILGLTPRQLRYRLAKLDA